MGKRTAEECTTNQPKGMSKAERMADAGMRRHGRKGQPKGKRTAKRGKP